jgi:hypothetical protein
MPNLTHEQVSDAMHIAYKYHFLLDALGTEKLEELNIQPNQEYHFVQMHRDMLREAYQLSKPLEHSEGIFPIKVRATDILDAGWDTTGVNPEFISFKMACNDRVRQLLRDVLTELLEAYYPEKKL